MTIEKFDTQFARLHDEDIYIFNEQKVVEKDILV